MKEGTWLGLLILFFVLPTILLSMRIYFDTSRYLRSGYLASSVVSLVFAIGTYIFFAIACAMTFYRSQHNVRGMNRDSLELERISSIQALRQPLHEGNIIHSYIVPTGLWLCKGSFVAMYFNLKRHLDKRMKQLLYGTVAYLIFTYLGLILTHALWCGGSRRQYALTASNHCTPFTNTLSISLYAFFNITSDILILLVPLAILRTISVLPRERYAIGFLMFLGVGTIVTTATCCGLHIAYRNQLVVFYNYIQLAELLSCIELAVAVCAVSLPSLKAMLYRKRELAKKRVHNSMGDTERSAKRSTRGSEADTELWEDEDGEGEEEDGRLVIMRRVSYGVREEVLPPAPPPQAVKSSERVS